MDGARFTVFLGRLIRTSTRKIFLIVDRLKAHEKAAVLEWVEAHQVLTPEREPSGTSAMAVELAEISAVRAVLLSGSR
jgi:hypothetical protein